MRLRQTGQIKGHHRIMMFPKKTNRLQALSRNKFQTIHIRHRMTETTHRQTSRLVDLLLQKVHCHLGILNSRRIALNTIVYRPSYFIARRKRWNDTAAWNEQQRQLQFKH